MRCPSCGNEVPEQARFCKKCGAKLAEGVKKAPMKPASGTEEKLREKKKSKPDRTGKMSDRTEKTPKKNVSGTKKRSVLPLVFLCLLLFAGAGFGGYKVYQTLFQEDGEVSVLDRDSEEDAAARDEDSDQEEETEAEPESEENETEAEDGQPESIEEDGQNPAETTAAQPLNPAETAAAWGSNSTDSTTAWGSNSTDPTTAWGSNSTDSTTAWGSNSTDSTTAWGSNLTEPTAAWGSNPANPTAAWSSNVPETTAAWPSDVAATPGDFILPDSSVRYLAASDLYGLTAEQLRLARNEIYARHGRRFSDETLQAYFDSKSWYSGTIEPSAFNHERMLNEYEKKNLTLIQEREAVLAR